MKKLKLLNKEIRLEEAILQFGLFDSVYIYDDKYATNGDIVINANVMNYGGNYDTAILPEKGREQLKPFLAKSRLREVLNPNNEVTFSNVVMDGCTLATNEAGTISELIAYKYSSQLDEFDCFYYPPANAFYFFANLVEGYLFVGTLMKCDARSKSYKALLEHLVKEADNWK
ncbi:MAG: hypothetical protein NC408_04585 [Candidatus Gastranaerophilales bacterium]|nr:hypothetical protein [Candidatus Gastranaerophilales bacterium]MCM1072251.1 hypothetical protein [Bacteroides sp.]